MENRQIILSGRGGPACARATAMSVSNNTLYVGFDTFAFSTSTATTAGYTAISGTQSVESGLPDTIIQPMFFSMFASGNTLYSAGYWCWIT